MGAVILDLDQTLVLTAALEPLRRARRWKDVYDSFGRTSLPPDTLEFVDYVRQIGPAGIVTSGPRPYAERLLAHHGIDLPVLVAYHDVAPRKPSPEPIMRAVALLGLTPTECVHVGDGDQDEVAARAAGVASILVDWSGCLPGHCTSWDEVVSAIDHAHGAVR